MQGVKTPLRIQNPDSLVRDDENGPQRSPLHTGSRMATMLHTPHSTSPGSNEFLQAVHGEDLGKVKELLKSPKGLRSVNLADLAHGYTPLMTAISYENDSLVVETCKELLLNGADPKICDKNGNNALHWAARLGKSEALKLISTWHSPTHENATLRDDLMIQNNELNTPLHEASTNGNLDCCKHLLASFIPSKKKLVPNVKIEASSDQRSPLVEEKEIMENVAMKLEDKLLGRDSMDECVQPEKQTVTTDHNVTAAAAKVEPPHESSDNVGKEDPPTGTKDESVPTCEVEIKATASVENDSKCNTTSSEESDPAVIKQNGPIDSTNTTNEIVAEKSETKDALKKKSSEVDTADSKQGLSKSDVHVKFETEAAPNTSELIKPHGIDADVPPPPAWVLLRNRDQQTAFDAAARSHRSADEADAKDKATRHEINDERKVLRRKLHELFCKCFPFFKTLILYHEECLGHLPVGENIKDIWEAPERLRAILAKVGGIKQSRMVVSNDFPQATREMLLRAHSKSYVDFVYNLSHKVSPTTPVPFTPRVQELVQSVPTKDLKKDDVCDTSFSKGSLNAAMRSCGAVVHAINQVVSGQQRNAFCIVRPPGHHAGIDGLMQSASSCGFCIFNNVMVGTLEAMEKHPDVLKRVAIIDFDVHHGNGTEEIVLRYNKQTPAGDGKLLFFSTHLYDAARPGSNYEFYPGSGHDSSPIGNVFNVPLAPLWRRRRMHHGNGRSAAERFYMNHFGRHEFRRAVTERMVPALRAFNPDLVVVSAGFDAGYRDVGNGRYMPSYKSGFDLKREDFYWVTRQLVEIANMTCQGRVVSVLEGGYGRLAGSKKEQRESNGLPSIDRSSLAKNCIAHIAGLLTTDEKVLSSAAQEELDSDGSDGSDGGADDGNTGGGGDDDDDDDAKQENDRKTRVRRIPARFQVDESSSKSPKGKKRGRGRPRKTPRSSDDSESASSDKDDSQAESQSVDASMDDSDEMMTDESSSEEDSRRRRRRRKGNAAKEKAAKKAKSKLDKQLKGKNKRGRKRKQPKEGSDDAARNDVTEKKKRKRKSSKTKKGTWSPSTRENEDDSAAEEDMGTNGEAQKQRMTDGGDAKNRKQKKRTQDDDEMRRELKKEDALYYLRQVKKKYETDVTTYKAFLSIMGDFKNKSLDVVQVTARVKKLFHGDNNLIMGFNTFLPPGYQIKLSDLQIENSSTRNTTEANATKKEQGESQPSVAASSGQQQQSAADQHAIAMQSMPPHMQHYHQMLMNSQHMQQHPMQQYMQQQWGNPHDSKDGVMQQQQHGYPAGYMGFPQMSSSGTPNDMAVLELQQQMLAHQFPGSVPYMAAAGYMTQQQMAMHQQAMQQQYAQQLASGQNAAGAATTSHGQDNNSSNVGNSATS